MASRQRPVPCRRDTVPYGDDDAILAAFRRDGYVVVRDVLTASEVEAAVDELWTSRQLLGRSDTVVRDEASTWASCVSWPQQNGGKNFLESVDPFQDRTCWEFVQHPHVVHLQRLLYGGAVLCTEVGRWGVMRPTKDHPEWRTEDNWLHWDQNPWREPEFTRVQCFACLTEQTPASGGFLCVPGFHNRFRAWGEEHPEGTVFVSGRQMTSQNGAMAPFLVPDDDPIRAQTVRVSAPPGALVLWDGRLPHQNYPNSGSEFRIVHYLNFVPAAEEAVVERRAALERKLAVLRALGRLREGACFPDGLTRFGREVTAAPGPAEDQLEPGLQAALQLLHQAGEEELKGNLDESTELMRKAGKVWPDIESWYDAVWGS
mmetsp:Transcript_16118/g.41722  ORF Transcript_16118/g.41722 Transcript_16118/m.41722 type:complete len:373 (+) Transcript_16118:3-1121(+)